MLKEDWVFFCQKAGKALKSPGTSLRSILVEIGPRMLLQLHQKHECYGKRTIKSPLKGLSQFQKWNLTLKCVINGI